jgi:multidrug efflux system outer membrane protein
MNVVQPSRLVNGMRVLTVRIHAATGLDDTIMSYSKYARHAITLMIAAVLTACAAGPDYRRPDMPAPDAFLGVDNPRFDHAEAEREFWTAFNDRQLNRLIEQALAANHDIRIATARLREARALRGEARLDFAPTVTEQAAQVDVRASERQAPRDSGLPRDQDYYETSFDAFWELDFFGRVRRSVEAASAEVQAAEADVYSTQVSVTAEVARNYFDLRGAQSRLEVAQRNAENQRESLRITSVRLEAGRGTQLDVSRAQAQLSATLGSIPDLEAQIANAMLRMSVLIGETPQALTVELSAPRALPDLPSTHSIGMPEALLRRRPDIMAAERQLAASTARIGIAVADLFPRISFIGSWGFDAVSSGDLGESNSEAYSFGPSIRWAAFDLGRVRQRIKQQEAVADAALARYEQTVLRALEETDASLTNYSKALVKQAHLKASAEASLEAVSLARVRFDNGATDFLTVLDAERSALQAEDALAQSETQTATALLAMYKALGGGFRPLPQAAQE